MGNEIFNLPRPTSQTIAGPKLCLDSSMLMIDYDFEDDDGSIEWTQVTFRDVLVFEYRQTLCCQAEDLDAYNRIVKYSDSDWLKTILERWEKFLGTQATKTQKDSYAHWRIYFDDVGCIDVIAQSFDID